MWCLEENLGKFVLQRGDKDLAQVEEQIKEKSSFIMSNLSIIQLNCRSIDCKFKYRKLLLYLQKSHIVAFFETWLQIRSHNLF